MTWQERRVVTLLGSILALLTAALLIVLGLRYREKLALREQQTADDPILDEVGEESRYTALTYFNGSTTLSFSRESGSWLWSDDTDFPLDETTVLAILEELDAWAPQQTLTDADALEKAGLSQPTASLTATTVSGTVATLLFGRTTDDGAGYYVRLNGDENTVYIISDALRKLMEIPIYDMCVVPALPALTEESITALLLVGPRESEDTTPSQITPISVQHDAEGHAVWRSGGTDLTDSARFQELLSDLARLSFARCVSYRPSEEAVSICGFDAPDAMLSVTYTDENGSDAHLSLTFGNRVEDGSGRYVRQNEDPTIYLMETELLDPLMSLATTGLS